jgi:hypothetical protein
MKAFNSLQSTVTTLADTNVWTALAKTPERTALTASPTDPNSLASPVLNGSTRQTIADLAFYVDHKQDVRSAKDQIKDKLDSMSELGETESQRLQMTMDRASKFMQTLSNLLGKIAGTASALVSNIK